MKMYAWEARWDEINVVVEDGNEFHLWKQLIYGDAFVMRSLISGITLSRAFTKFKERDHQSSDVHFCFSHTAFQA